MVDIAIKDNLKTYFNWVLAWTPNTVYDEIVNWEIVKPWHRKRKAANSFFLRKRKWFKQAFTWITWTITDIQDLYDTTCSTNVWWRYYYSVNSTNFYVYKREIWACTAPTLIDSWVRLLCASTKFCKTDFVKWPKRNLYTVSWTFDSYWTHVVDTWSAISPSFIPDWASAFAWNASNWPQNWDYIWSYWWINRWNNSVPCQVRRVVWTWTYSAKVALIVDSPREMIDTTTPKLDAWNWFSVHPSWWEVLLYNSIDQWYMWATTLHCVKIIHSPYSINSAWAQTTTDTITTVWNTIDQYWVTDKAVTTMTEHDWKVVMTFDNWHLAYWANSLWDGSYYKFLWDIDRTVIQNIGKDIIDSASFRDFLMLFGRDRIIACVFDSAWNSKRFILRDDLWIHNKWAFCLYDNSMYIVWSDARLYSVSISWDWEWLQLSLEDQSQPMLWHLDTIKENDIINLVVNKKEIRIFQNITDNIWVTWAVVTKIINFDKDYQLIHTRETIANITSVYKTEYYWTAVYHNCWIEDWSWNYYRARINCYIWDNEPSSVESNLFEKKAINRGKIILWNWIYNTAYTYLRVFTLRDWWKTDRVLSWFWEIPILQKYATWLSNWTVSTDSCLTLEWEETIRDWVDFLNQTWRDWTRNKTDPRCWPTSYWCPTYVEEYAEWINIHSQLNKLAETYVIPIPLTTQPSDVIKIEFSSWGWDTATFWWMMFEVQKTPFDDMSQYWDNVLYDANCSRAVLW